MEGQDHSRGKIAEARNSRLTLIGSEGSLRWGSLSSVPFSTPKPPTHASYLSSFLVMVYGKRDLPGSVWTGPRGIHCTEIEKGGEEVLRLGSSEIMVMVLFSRWESDSKSDKKGGVRGVRGMEAVGGGWEVWVFFFLRGNRLLRRTLDAIVLLYGTIFSFGTLRGKKTHHQKICALPSKTLFLWPFQCA